MSVKKIFIETCKQSGLPAPTPEYQFAKDAKRRWRIDYYFEHEDRKVALEVEGGIWTKGRHTRSTGFVKDMDKYNEMAKRGILLIRVEPKNLLTTGNIENIKNALNK